MISLNNIGAGETEAIDMTNELDLQKSLSNAWQLIQDQVLEFIPWSLYHGVYTMEFILEFIQNAPQSVVQEAKTKLIMITKISSHPINIWLLLR